MADNVVFTIEGKPVPISRDVVNAGKDAVKAVLVASGFPAAAVADIQMPNERTGAPAVVSPRSTGKGGDLAREHFITTLLAAPPYVNPAIALAAECLRAEGQGDEEFVERAHRTGALERAVHEGMREGRGVEKALQTLGRVAPCPSRTVPVGF